MFTDYEQNDYLFHFSLQGESLGTDFHRSYEKIQDIATKIGGIIKAIMIVGTFISKICSDVEFNLYLSIFLEKYDMINQNKSRSNLSEFSQIQKQKGLSQEVININNPRNIDSLQQCNNIENLNINRQFQSSPKKENNNNPHPIAESVRQLSSEPNFPKKNDFNSIFDAIIYHKQLQKLGTQYNKEQSIQDYSKISYCEIILNYFTCIFCCSNSLKVKIKVINEILNNTLSVENLIIYFNESRNK